MGNRPGGLIMFNTAPHVSFNAIDRHREFYRVAVLPRTYGPVTLRNCGLARAIRTRHDQQSGAPKFCDRHTRSFARARLCSRAKRVAKAVMIPDEDTSS